MRELEVYRNHLDKAGQSLKILESHELSNVDNAKLLENILVNTSAAQKIFCNDSCSSLNLVDLIFIQQESSMKAVMIPLSSLQKDIIIQANNLAKVSAEYDQSLDTISLADMRRIVENKRICEAKLEMLHKDIESVSTTNMAFWRAENLAMNIARISAAIYLAVDPRKDLWSNIDGSIFSTSANVKCCLEFHIYLERFVSAFFSFSRIFISALVSVPKAPIQTPETQTILASKHHLLASTMQTVLETIYHLFYTFRDLNSASALLYAINSLQVARLSQSWELLGSKGKEMYKHLSTIIPLAEMSTHKHIDVVNRFLDSFYKSNCVCVIPFLFPVLSEIKTINNIYVTGHHIECGKSIDVLTEIGAKGLESIINMLEACQGGKRHVTINENPLHPPSDEVNRTIWTQLPPDLAKLCNTASNFNPKIEHFLLTRIYYNQADLWLKSMLCEPLGKREKIPIFKEIVFSDVQEHDFGSIHAD